MSDRLVLLPYRDDQTAPWADVVIAADADPDAIRAAAAAFARCPGPHKIFTTRRDDPRLVILTHWLDEDHAFSPCDELGSWGWCYTVLTPEDFPRGQMTRCGRIIPVPYLDHFVPSEYPGDPGARFGEIRYECVLVAGHEGSCTYHDAPAEGRARGW